MNNNNKITADKNFANNMLKPNTAYLEEIRVIQNSLNDIEIIKTSTGRGFAGVIKELNI